MNLKYVVNNLLKNFIMLFLKKPLAQRGSLGLDGDPALILETLARMGRMADKFSITVTDKVVYELGSGRTPYLMIAFGLAGAQKVIGLDVRKWMHVDWDYSQSFEYLLSKLEKDAGKSFIKGFSIDNKTMQESLENLSCSNPIQYNIYSGVSF